MMRFSAATANRSLARLGHIKKIVGDHPFCFKEVGRAGGVFFIKKTLV